MIRLLKYYQTGETDVQQMVTIVSDYEMYMYRRNWRTIYSSLLLRHEGKPK